MWAIKALQYNIDNRHPRLDTAPMPLSRCCAMLIAIVALVTLPARVNAQDHAAGAHEHGVGSLDLALDGGRLEIAVTAPGSDIVGFEGQPADSDDADKVQAAVAALGNAATLFAFEPAAACTPAAKPDVDPPAAALQAPGGSTAQADAAHAHAHDHKESEPEHAHEHAEGSASHGDWSASYTFDCTAPTAVIVNLFDAFPSLQEVRAQVIAPGAQTGAELTPAARRIALGATR